MSVKDCSTCKFAGQSTEGPNCSPCLTAHARGTRGPFPDYVPACPVQEMLDEVLGPDGIQNPTTDGGIRFTSGKTRVDLVPPDAIMALADLMTANSHKYPDRNWELGMEYSKVLASMERHLLKLKAGEDIDPTDNQPNAIKVMWNAMALFCYWHRGVGTDDRYKVPMPGPRPLPADASATAAAERLATYG